MGEVALGGKTGVLGHLSDAVIGVGKQLLAGFDAGLAQIPDRGTAAVHGKGVSHIIFIQMRELCQGIQGNVLDIVCLDIPFYFDTFLADLKGGRYLKGKVCPADQLDNQHFQKVLADKLAVLAFLFHLLQHGTHIKEQILLLPAATENNVVFIFFERKA